MLQEQHQLPRSEIVQGHYSCWNGPDSDDSSPYLCSTFVPEATRLYGIDIEPIRFRDGKIDERRVCSEATFDCIRHRGRWVKGADNPHDGVSDKSQSFHVAGGANASNAGADGSKFNLIQYIVTVIIISCGYLHRPIFVQHHIYPVSLGL